MYLLLCQFCGYKQVAVNPDEIKLVPITLCSGSGKLNEGGGRGQKVSKKFKCPNCGRVITTRSAIPSEKEESPKNKEFDILH